MRPLQTTGDFEQWKIDTIAKLKARERRIIKIKLDVWQNTINTAIDNEMKPDQIPQFEIPQPLIHTLLVQLDAILDN